MEGREQVIFDEEAAVAELATAYFWDKILIDKRLFEIDKEEQDDLKPPQTAQKSGGKKNFHFGNFGVKKWEKVGVLRKHFWMLPMWKWCQYQFQSQWTAKHRGASRARMVHANACLNHRG